MSLPDRLSKTLPTPPLVLHMIAVPEGIKVGFYREGKIASYADVMGLVGLPAPVIQFLRAQGKPQEHVYHLAWPDAKALHDAVRAAPSDRLILEANDLETLTRIEQPADFRLHWSYNADLKRLERHLINADNHLGKGWFSKGKTIWSLNPALPDNISQWLSLPTIRSAYLYRFVAEFMTSAEKMRWPATCDLHIERGVTLRLDITRMRGHELEVQLSSNKPGILESLDSLPEDTENLISGTSLLPGFHDVFSERLLKIAHAKAPVSISGSELASFIEDDLRPHAAALRVDMSQIDGRYPILKADQLGLRWRITHEIAEAVGRYEATPYIADVPLRTFSTVPAGERFVAAAQGWIEMTPAFRTRLLDWKSQGLARFQISPQELLGLPTERVQMTGLRLPEIVLPEAPTSLDRLAVFLDVLRRYGLPGGVAGLQADAPALLIGVCQRLFKENPRAKILWIVGQRARPSVADALRRAQVAYANAEAVQPTFSGKIEGRVTLTSPGEQVELAKTWTLIIFEDLDLLAFSDAQIYFYYQLERQWSLGTFSRIDWAEDRRRAQQALHALQLAPENLATFSSSFVRAFPRGSRTRLDRLVSPLKRVFTGNTNAVPATPLRLQPSPLDKPPIVEPPIISEDTPVHQPAPILPAIPSTPPLHPVRALSPKVSFVVQARRYANRTEPPTDPVPFNVSWPTYDAMTPQQQQWYFYWRSQARLGNFLPTDTGYLFLNAYEIVNLIGFSTPQDAFTSFVNLWKHYRVTVPKLDRYFVDWLADFTVVYPVSTGSLQWYNEAREEGATCGSFDLCVEAWIRSGADVDMLPVDFLYQVAGYSPAKTKFYQENNSQGRLDAAYKKGVRAVDQFLRGTDGESLFTMFRPAEPRPIKREPFAGTFYARGRDQRNEPITVALASPWSLRDGNVLSRRLTAIIKTTENILRRQANYRAQLQGIDLPHEWQAILDKTFAAPRRQLKIDMPRVDSLRRETDEIRRRLIVEDDAEPAQPPLHVEVLPSINSSAPIATAEPASDLAAVAAIIGDVQGTRAHLLRILRDHQWQADQATLNGAMLPGQFLNVELDYLNESAVEQLGDSLIFEENGLYVVAEDYRDEITTLLATEPHPESSTSSSAEVVTNHPPSVEDDAPVDQANYSGMDDHWAQFAMRMKPYHWEALAALLGNTDVQSRLEAIARSVGMTANRLIDDMNGFALDTIGDIVIATDREPPYIADEDISDLQALLTWAQNKALLQT